MRRRLHAGVRHIAVAQAMDLGAHTALSDRLQFRPHKPTMVKGSLGNPMKILTDEDAEYGADLLVGLVRDGKRGAATDGNGIRRLRLGAD
jgi:hypothetical protein